MFDKSTICLNYHEFFCQDPEEVAIVYLDQRMGLEELSRSRKTRSANLSNHKEFKEKDHSIFYNGDIFFIFEVET